MEPKNSSPATAASLFVIMPSQGVIQVILSPANKLAIAAGQPVPLTIPLWFERNVGWWSDGELQRNIVTALDWGYAVRIIPRAGGPGTREVASG